jgi:hypothetical protein
MARQVTLIPRKRRGPAPTGKGAPVMTRLQPDTLAALDAYIAGQPEAISRPEAIRRLVELGLLKGRRDLRMRKLTAKRS